MRLEEIRFNFGWNESQIEKSQYKIQVVYIILVPYWQPIKNTHMNDTDKLIKTEIKGRQVTYFLTSVGDLNNLRSNSLLGDIFTVLTSLAIGGIISVLLTKATAIEIQKETLNILEILLYVFIAGTLIFGGFTAYFYYKAYGAIKIIKESGEIKSFNSVDQMEEVEPNTKLQKKPKSQDNKLEIIKATYWTPKVKLDVTEELRQMIVDNKLDIVASNKIKYDPDEWTVKKLSIEYRFNYLTVSKEFTENDRVVLP